MKILDGSLCKKIVKIHKKSVKIRKILKKIDENPIKIIGKFKENLKEKWRKFEGKFEEN